MTFATPSSYQNRPIDIGVHRSLSAMLFDIDNLQISDESISFLLRRLPPAGKIVLMGMFHPDIMWDLPEGLPPFKPSTFDAPSAIHRECRKIPLLWKRSGPEQLASIHREMAFVRLLETLDEGDAALVAAAKERKSPFKRITGHHVAAAWPDRAIMAAYPTKTA